MIKKNKKFWFSLKERVVLRQLYLSDKAYDYIVFEVIKINKDGTVLLKECDND